MKKSKKIIALLLSLIMIICSLPITAFAEGLGELQSDESVEIINEESTESEQKWYVIDEQEIISDQVIGNVVEVTSLREENVKHFRLSDGTYEAIVYAEPVHRKDANGEWQEINNNIELQNHKGLTKYSTQDSRISFANSFKANSDIFTLSENGYSVSMSLLSNGIEDDVISTSPIELSPIPIVNNSSSVRNTTKFDSLEEAKNIDNRASIVYNNIRKNTNIEYVLKGNDVKENIIVTAPCQEYEYVFQLNLSRLSAIMTENGEVLLKDADTDEIKYVIPAPYMYDANGVYCYDVSYTLEQVKDEIYLIAVTADSEWINSTDRAFPVVIDPTLSYRGVCCDSYVDANYPNTNYGQDTVMWVSDACAAFIKIDMPNLPEGSSISTAYLHVPYYYNITTGSMMATAHQITENWLESNITFNNYPDVSTSTLDMVSMPAGSNITASSPGTAKFKITDLFKSWYNGTPNYGVMIMRRSSAMGENQSVIFKSREAGAERAYLAINYAYYLPDGVYAFENVEMDNFWIKLSNNDTNDYLAGNRLKYEGSSDDPSDPETFDRTRLFKITRIGNTARYTIRSMIDNNISFNIVDGKVIATDIPSIDSQVAVSDTFNIECNGYGFTISPYNSSYVLSMYDLSVNNISYEAKSNASYYATWDLKQYTGAEAKGYQLLTNLYPFVVGETATLRAAVWSTEAGYNYPNLSVKPEDSSKISFEWNSTTRTASAEFLATGQITIRWKIYNQNLEDYVGGSNRYNILPSHYMFTVNHYIDNGYETRFDSTGQDISEYQYICSQVLSELFNVNCSYTINTYSSCADICTGIPTTFLDTTTSCTHSNTNHKTRLNIKNDLVSQFNAGNNTTTKIAWTGHVLETRSSCSYSSEHVVVMTIGMVVDADNNNMASNVIRYQRIYTLLHETSHQLGAPDHYCYDESSTNCNNPSNDCWRCDNGLSSPPVCIMTSRTYDIESRLSAGNIDTLYCDQCKSYTHSKGIPKYLSEHYQ